MQFEEAASIWPMHYERLHARKPDCVRAILPFPQTMFRQLKLVLERGTHMVGIALDFSAYDAPSVDEFLH